LRRFAPLVASMVVGIALIAWWSSRSGVSATTALPSAHRAEHPAEPPEDLLSPEDLPAARRSGRANVPDERSAKSDQGRAKWEWSVPVRGIRSSGFSGSIILRTDAAGRFRHWLLPPLPERAICVLAFSNPARGAMPHRRALREFDLDSEGALIELGDVLLVAPDR
jgi:hypothetical protein